MPNPATFAVNPLAKKRIKVLIVDDSALVRRMLTEMLSSDPAITVLGAAHDAYDAREKIKALNPAWTASRSCAT
jgi:PleD family two-component response regulator